MSLRPRPRPLTVGGVIAGTLLLVVLVTLITDVGTPDGGFSSAPDPCQLLSDETVRELVTDGWTSDRSDHSEQARWFEPHNEFDGRLCTLAGPRFALDRQGSMEASVMIWVYRYTSTQLNLGPSGAVRASEGFKETRRQFRELARADCIPLADPRADVCGVPSRGNRGFTLLVRRENISVDVSFHGGLVREAGPLELAEYSNEWLGQRMAEATEHILARLDQTP